MNKFNRLLTVVLVVFTIGIGVAYATAETIKLDVNDRPVSAAVTNDASADVKMLRVDSGTGALLTTSSFSAASATSVFDGRKVVTTAGTAVPITAATKPFTRCDFQSETDNTGNIVIGASTVDETQATRRGIMLYPGESYHAESHDLQYVYIDSSVNGDGVTYTCWQ